MLSAQAHLALSKVQNTLGGRRADRFREGNRGEPARFMLAWKRAAAGPVTTGAPQLRLRGISSWFCSMSGRASADSTRRRPGIWTKCGLPCTEPRSLPRAQPTFDTTQCGVIRSGSNTLGAMRGAAGRPNCGDCYVGWPRAWLFIRLSHVRAWQADSGPSASC